MMLNTMILKSLAIPGGILFFYIAFYLMYVKGWVRRLDDTGWKKVDYWWIGIGTIALFIQFFQVIIRLDTASLATEQSIAQAINQDLNIAAADLSGPSICLPATAAVRKERSLELIKELDDACTFFTVIRPAVRLSDNADTRVLNYLAKQSTLRFTNEELQRKAERLSTKYEDYLEQNHEVAKIDKGLKANKAVAEFAQYLAFLSLIVAVALRLVKVTGEIRVKKESSEFAKVATCELEDSIRDLRDAIYSLQVASEERDRTADLKDSGLGTGEKKLDAVEVSFPNHRTVLIRIISTAIAAVLLARVL